MSDCPCKQSRGTRIFTRFAKAGLDLGTTLIVLKLIGVEPLASQWAWWQVSAPWLAMLGALAFCALVVGVLELTGPKKT